VEAADLGGWISKGSFTPAYGLRCAALAGGAVAPGSQSVGRNPELDGHPLERAAR